MGVGIVDIGFFIWWFEVTDWFDRDVLWVNKHDETDYIDLLDEERDGFFDVEVGYGYFVGGMIWCIVLGALLYFLCVFDFNGFGME